jgi:asparagine synthase (glutamine-hydrolysing)
VCGIAGVVCQAPDGVKPETIATLQRTLGHRGPDDQGCLQWSLGEQPAVGRQPRHDRASQLALAHRRLSILDPSSAGWQPMSSPDGRHHLVYNGEIYNYLELRDELASLGHAFRSGSDSEVLLSAYREWGSAALGRFTGMFAFAVLDLRGRRLFLARDPLGIKPLFYATWPGGMAFASEIKALLALPQVGRRVAPGPLYDYLRFGLTDHGPQTFFADVRQVPAACWIDLDLARPWDLRTVRYWQPPVERPADLSFPEAATRLRELFLDSVRLHLRSDVPVGAALSGGIDSSAIVLAMRALGGQSVDVRAVGYLAEEEPIGEERWIRTASRAARAALHTVEIRPAELVADLDELISVQDEPFGSTSIYAQFRVFRRAREAGLTVMLDGQGADELLAGYRPFAAARAASLLRSGRVWAAARFAVRSGAQPGAPGPGSTLLRGAFALLPGGVATVARRLKRDQAMLAWLDRGWFERAGVLRPDSRTRGWSLRAELDLALTATSLPALLRYEDRNSMAHGIESRVPFLTRELVEFVASLPEEYLLDGDGTTKAVFRAAMRGLVPDAILDRRDKIGFATPEQRWLATLRPWVDELLAGDAAAGIPALRLGPARLHWQAVRNGQKPFDWSVWRWLNLIRWSERNAVSYAA